MTDKDQKIVWNGEFLPYGEEYSITGNVINNFRFPGQYLDKETGLHQNWHRDYHPPSGTYRQSDPIGFLGGINLYSYGNNPANIIDPMGLWDVDVHAGIGNSKYGTYKWAKDLNFFDSEAAIIAYANNAVDRGPSTHFLPWYWGGDQSRHFNSFSNGADSRTYWAEIEFNKAIAFAKKDNCKAALGHLGKGLHSLQDKYAHRNWELGFFGLNRHPSWYDDWNDSRNVSTATLTEIATKQYLRNFLNIIRR